MTIAERAAALIAADYWRTAGLQTVEVGVYRIPLAVQQTAMGIDWMRLEELSQAIPPAYSHFIAESWLAQQARLAA